MCCSARPALHDLRVVKSEAEVRLLRESCRIGAEAVRSAMAATRSLGTEGAVLATVEHSARMAGACHPAYPPVVAAGNNATVIVFFSYFRQVLYDLINI